MSSPIDWLLRSVCHRGGASDLLPLCLRCSSVYAGVLSGAAFEAILQVVRRRGPGLGGILLNAGGLAAMAVVGLGDLYGLFAVPAAVKVLSGLWFGAAVAFFAMSAIRHELSSTTPSQYTGSDDLLPAAADSCTCSLSPLPSSSSLSSCHTASESRGILWARFLLIGLFAAWSVFAGAGREAALWLVGLTASGGVVVAFAVVNFAFALVLLRGVSRRAWRVAGSAVLLIVLTAVEFGLFRLWRSRCLTP